MKQETEMERLKRQADEQKVQQRFESLHQYLVRCAELSNEAFNEWAKWRLYEAIALVVMLFTAVMTAYFDLGKIFFDMSWWLWFAIFIYMLSFIEYKRNRAESEFAGAMNALDRLGFLTHIDSGTRKRKKRERFKTTLEELWERAKQLARKEVYGFA